MHVSVYVYMRVCIYTRCAVPLLQSKFVSRERKKEDSIHILAMSKAKAGTIDHFFKNKSAVITGNVETRSK